MNFCTKCASYYQHPGTCNCFAGVAGLGDGPQPWYPGVTPVWINPSHPHDGTAAPQPSPYDFPTTCEVYMSNDTRTVARSTVVSSAEVAYDPTVPFTYTDGNSFEPIN